MAKKNLYFTSDQKEIELKRLLGQGGEGSVYTCNRKGRAVKIYAHPLSNSAVDKLRAMIAMPPGLANDRKGISCALAWPSDLVMDKRGKVVGYEMPRVRNGLTLQELIVPKLRLDKAPGFNLLYLHTAARNIATVFDSVHSHGYVVGDVNRLNILALPTGEVVLIDTDSFQVPDPRRRCTYTSPVGSIEFTPAEIHTCKFAEVRREQYHDTFALGILVHLLLLGNHPYAGQWTQSGNPPEIAQAIAKGWSVFTRGGPITRSPKAVPLSVVSPEIAGMFRRCFVKGHINPDERPTAKEWADALGRSIKSLTQCTVNPQHYYDHRNAECYWCKRSCRGMDVFPLPAARKRANPVKELKPMERTPLPLMTRFWNYLKTEFDAA